MKHLVAALACTAFVSLAAHAARANPRCHVPADAGKAFEQVTGATAEDVASFVRPDGELLIGAWKAGKQHRMTAGYVVLKSEKDGGRCAGAILELGAGDKANVQGLVDLDQAGALWDSKAWRTVAPDAQPAHAAVLVLITHGNDTDLVLFAAPPAGGRVLARTPFVGADRVELTGDGAPRDLAVHGKTLRWKNGAYK